MKTLFKFVLLTLVLSGCIKHIPMVVNPYKGVDWKNDHQYKANFHTHTNNSDGNFNANYVVDTYASNDYSIVMITDHNLVTYPWNEFSKLNPKWENRNPDSLKVLTFPGNELSEGHHRGMFFARITGGGRNLDSTFMQVQDSVALSIFNHPGRYWKINKTYNEGEKFSPDWYVNYFRKYPVAVGIEVYNCPEDRYPHDRVLWDEILTRTMPDRPVWGYANDDMHGQKQLMGNYEFMLMDKLSIPSLKNTMRRGAFYISNEPGQSGKALAPRIDSIKVDEPRQKITVFAQDYDSIIWISGISGQDSTRTNAVVAKGEVFNWSNFNKSYVRFELKNEKGVTLSQPFGFQINQSK